jgi:23S rRNA (cytosine1962-C5)-methyltransferase
MGKYETIASMTSYRLLDCGNQEKIEKLGDYTVVRPCPQAIWKPFNPKLWESADARFDRTVGEKGIWKALKNPENLKRKHLGSGLPENWEITSQSKLKWRVRPNDFGNIGVFTEHWQYAPTLVNWFDKKGKVLNLFAYTGSNALDLVKAGYKVTVVDSSSVALDDYTYNMGLNQLHREGQRFILEDVYKFLAREVRRKSQYESIICDAPSFGRGTKGEVFAIEEDLIKILEATRDLLTKKGRMVLTLHSPRFTPMILQILVTQIFAKKQVEVNEILNPCESGVQLPSGFLVKIW